MRTARHLRLPTSPTGRPSPGSRTSSDASTRGLGGRPVQARVASRQPWRRSPFASSAARSRTRTRTRSARRLLRDGHEERARRASRRRQHLLRHERGRAQVAAGRRAGRAHAPARLRDRVCGANLERAFAGLPAERDRRRAAERGDARRSSPATSARSAACRPTRGSTGSAPSSASRTAAASRAASA